MKDIRILNPNVEILDKFKMLNDSDSEWLGRIWLVKEFSISVEQGLCTLLRVERKCNREACLISSLNL